MRSFIRHPSDIPVEVVLEQGRADDTRLNNISHGGLSFDSPTPIDSGAVIRLRIALDKLAFEARGQVVWCHKRPDHYVIGLEFLDKDDLFKVRMVEQICHIEHYKKEVMTREGRSLTSQQAAMEWVRKYAHKFPQ